MSDKELLSCVAKAAGFGDASGKVCWTDSEYPRNSGRHGALWNYVGHMDTAELWNPLEDDGDALRLAVDLALNVFHTGGCAYAMESDCDGSDEQKVSYHSIGKYAAARRAIVRAAAKIGGAK